MKKYIILFIISFCFAISFAQKQLQISAEGKKYTIPCFKEDSVLELEKWYTDQNIIEPIKQSKCDWEIRMFSIRQGLIDGKIYTIGSLNDSICMNEIWYDMGDSRDSVFRKEKLVYGSDGSTVFKREFQFKPIVPIDSFLQNIIINQLGCLEDTKDVVESLKLKKNLSTPYHEVSITFFEFKINKLYRNFELDRSYIKGNAEISYFKSILSTINSIHQLFDKQSKQYKNDNK